MQRRIEEADGGREALERLEDADEVFALIRQQLRQRGFAVFDVVGENHFAHRVDAVAFEEHVLGAGEADAGRAERDGVARSAPACRRWCGPGGAVALRAPLHELEEVLELLGGLRGLVAVQQAGDDLGRRGLDLAAHRRCRWCRRWRGSRLR